MKNSPALQALILKAIRSSSGLKTQSGLAEHLGHGKPWVTKLLNGTLKFLTDEQVQGIEDYLGVELQGFEENHKVSALAKELAATIDRVPGMGKAFIALVQAAENAHFLPRYFSTKEMSGLGQEIIKISYANEDKPGKVARLTLELISSYRKR